MKGGKSLLLHGNCFDLFSKIQDESIDMVLCDPPYGTTDCKWDVVLDLNTMWEELHRVCKKNAAIVFTASQPFTTTLIASNMKGFKYCWVWDKQIPGGMGYAKYRPMQQTEDCVIFEKDGQKTNYYPVMIKRDKPIKAGGNKKGTENYGGYSKLKGEYKKTYTYKNPTNLISFMKIRRNSSHSTQKPVELMEYLIKTYTNPGDTVLDFCMGSGTTGVACANLHRQFIGIEKEKKYFEIAQKRITKARLLIALADFIKDIIEE